MVLSGLSHDISHANGRLLATNKCQLTATHWRQTANRQLTANCQTTCLVAPEHGNRTTF